MFGIEGTVLIRGRKGCCDEDLNLVQNSYKRLASKWHPGKHKNSAESQKKFKKITRAYCLLAADESDEDVTMTLDEMLHIFQQTVTGKSPALPARQSKSKCQGEMIDAAALEREINIAMDATANGYGSSDEGDDEDEDDCLDGCERQLAETKRVENANELISEEEKERRRAEKRRAKKKRRRERKKLEKLEQQPPKQNEKSSQHKNKVFNESQNDRKSKKSDKKLVPDTSEDEADFDPSSAFFTNIVNKKKKNLNISEQSQVSNKDRSKDRATLQSHSAKSEDEIEELDTVVLRSRKLAIRGNEMAQVGHYNAAIDLFTEAIRLDPTDFRFFGNRSYCYERIQQYDKALKDAEKSISISPKWPKGYFRKGRALAGQKQYSTAEQAFLQVVRLDKNCEDAKQELLRVRTYQITEMGFTKSQAEAAINQHGTVQVALDSLLAGVAAENSLNDGLESDEDEFCMNNSMTHTHTGPIYNTSSSPTDTKMNPANPEGLTALWVGNVLPEVTEKKLNQMFSKHGPVTSVRCLPNRFCAFINFKTKESAGKAMNSLQGTECGGQKLLIKFPDNPIVNGGNVTLRKTSAPSNCKMVRSNLPKQSGPVNGNECYFWRTTGCQFADKCHYRHFPDHKGLDLKPWHKVK